MLQPPLRRLLPADTQLLPEEFGSSLDVQMCEGLAALSWFLGSHTGSAGSTQDQQQQQRYQQRRAADAAADAAAAATPAELRQLFAAEAAGDDLGWDGAEAAAAGADDQEEDVDIDSDDERKGRGKKVRETSCLNFL